MKFDSQKIQLLIGEKEFKGISNDSLESYFGYKYIFENDTEALDIKKFLNYKGENLANEVCITIHCEEYIYKHTFFAKIGKKNNRIFFEIYFDYPSSSWDEKININHFLSNLEKKLLDGTQQNYDFKYETDGLSNDIVLSFDVTPEDELHEYFDKACNYIRDTHKKCLKNFFYEEEFFSQFVFPEHLKSSFFAIPNILWKIP